MNKPSLSHHHVYRWSGYHSQSWVFYDIGLPTLIHHPLNDGYCKDIHGKMADINGTDIFMTITLRELNVASEKSP